MVFSLSWEWVCSICGKKDMTRYLGNKETNNGYLYKLSQCTIVSFVLKIKISNHLFSTELNCF